MVKLFRVLILIYAFYVRFIWCQNTIPSTTTISSSCRPGDIRCNANGKDRTQTNSTTDASAKSETKLPTITENLRGRAMNFTSAFQDNMRNNGLETAGSSSPANSRPTIKEHSIDDVSMDDMDDDSGMNLTNIMSSMPLFNNMMNAFQRPKSRNLTCTDRDNNTYTLGEKFKRGCDETCQCLESGMVCSQLCKPPLHVKGRNNSSNCEEEPVSACCVSLRCHESEDSEPIDGCFWKSKPYKQGERFVDGCENCFCNAGRVTCAPRCEERNATENCVLLPNPNDACCKIALCDVEAHDITKMDSIGSEDSSLLSSTTDNQITSVKVLNSTAVILTFAEKQKDCNVEMSTNGIDWENVKCSDNIVSGLQAGKKYHFKLKNMASNLLEVTIPSLNQTMSSTCEFKGKTYKLGEEFNDGCRALCWCDPTGVQCALIECPTDFGLDVLDPHCLEWDTYPLNFVPSPPQCCPEKVLCRNNGSCMYNGETFPNWSELPVKITGCEKKCYCEMNNVTCSTRCSRVSETPPTNLHCPPDQAVRTRSPEDECCFVWTCPSTHTGNESFTSITNDSDTYDTFTALKPQPKLPTTKPSTDFSLQNKTTDEETYTNSITNTAGKKEAYPGPFSPQYILKHENSTNEQQHHHPKKPNQEILVDLLAPFHLEKFADQIEKDLQANTTTEGKEDKKTAKKPSKTHFKPSDQDEEDEAEDEDAYDDKPQYDDIFADIFDSKHKNKNVPAKQPFWPVKHPDIPELVKNPQLQVVKSPPVDEKDAPPSGAEFPPDFPKKHNAEKEGLYANKKAKPHDDKVHEVKIFENTPNHQFVPYAHIPYSIPEGIYPNMNPALKYPASQQEIVIHQGQNPAAPGFGHGAFKPPPIHDPSQSEEFFHVIDNDAYTEDQIRQTLPYHPGQELPSPFQNGVIKSNKGSVRVQHPGMQNINVEDVLTHLHHETNANNNNNNAHLPNILPGPIRHHPQQNFNFHNYQETLSADQTSHPLLLHPELGKPSLSNDTSRDEIKMHLLEAVDETTIKLVFSVPAFLVGLHGRIELRYTADQMNNEPSTWEQQILAPPNDLIATKELEFELGGLLPNTTYKIKISVMMHDIDNAPTSQILTIRTLSGASTTVLPPIIPVDPELKELEVNSTYAKVGWRMFTNFELQFIDGVQLRYKEIDDKVYGATPLIHRAVTTYTIEELKPDSIYEVGIFFIPFPGQTTELQAQRTIEIRTSIENDPYKFDITMEVHNIKTTSVEIRWSGIPYPEDKYVNIFRAIYQSDGNREDSSSFKVAKRDSPQSILIQELKPATRYRLWLEAYLTNGRTKKSNVKDFITKLGPGSSTSTSQGKLEGMALMESNSYYGPLVVVSIVATIAIMSTVVLLLVLAKKHGTNKAPITSPINRKNNSSAAYDNPTYKTCENTTNRLNGNSSKITTIAMAVLPKNYAEKEI